MTSPRPRAPALALLATLLAACAEQSTAPDAPPPADVAKPDDAADDVAPPDDTAPAVDEPTAPDAPPPDAPDAPAPMDAPAPPDVAPDVAPPTDAAVDRPAPSDALPPPLPYPTRSAYRIKALQPDFWPDRDEVVGNNTGGVAMNLVWAVWEPSRRAPPCAAADVEYDGRCYAVDAAVDEAIRAYTARGLVVTAVVYGSPAWARVPRCTPAAPGFEWFCDPADPRDYGRFAGMLARRYDGRRGNGRVADFVVWNEVNHNDWYDIGCGGASGACDAGAWVTRYAGLYNAAYDAVAAEQPSAKVLVSLEHHFGAVFDRPAAPSPMLSGETFLRGFASRVAPRAWRVAFHPYPPDLLRPGFSPDDYPRVTYGSMGALLGWLRRNYPGVPSAWEVQFTESGVNSLGPGSSPEAQARGVCDSFRNVLGTPGVESYVYHRMVDHPDEVRGGLALGLRNADRSPKPAWAVWALANRNDLTPPMLSCGFEDLPYTRVRRSYDAARGHWASSRIAPPGFREEAAWRLWRDPEPGTVPLYECRVGEHNLLTRDPNCEGQLPMGPVGYAYEAPRAGAIPLHRCRVGEGADHFISTDPRCEGHAFESTLGYGLPAP